MTKKSEAIYAGDEFGNKVELTGDELEAFLVNQKRLTEEIALLEAKESERKQLRIDAITKLGAASGLTEEEINSILNI
jgi:hypothetical protein